MLSTNRGCIKFIVLSIITFGIYGIVVFSKMSQEINIIASAHDDRHTMHYCWIYFIFSWLTLGIAPLVWYTNISSRIGNEARRRGMATEFCGGSFWGWNILGSIIIVGPFIYLHKLFKTMNYINADFNTYAKNM